MGILLGFCTGMVYLYRMKRALISVGIFVGLLAVVAVAMELTASQQQLRARYFRTRSVFQYDKEHVVFDPVLGYRLTPRMDVTFDNTEFSTRVRTNAVGFRDDDASLNAPDVLFLGDSYAFGWGVNEEEGVEKQYERLTGKKVLNMAVPGYGNVQELLMLYKWEGSAQVQGKKIFLFLSPNDLLDNENTSFGAFPYFVEQAGSFRIHEPATAGFDEWQTAVDEWHIKAPIARRNMLAYYCLNALKNIRVKDLYKDHLSGERAVKGTKAFVLVAEELARFAKETQCALTIVYIPAMDAEHNKYMPLVRDVCAKLGLQFADLGQVITPEDVYPMDMHWKASGHSKAAALVSAL
ncbi:hypothetical protein GCM10023093_11940 [Nemorincola caseinilytica]|uniref:SGNH hydrolase-type esterase domain-containing protein n=1 Tax=Nemorincola caseinilytica TaxID=2054315 RepID=A0ABP8NC39_9BACT